MPVPGKYPGANVPPFHQNHHHVIFGKNSSLRYKVHLVSFSYILVLYA